MNAPIEELEKLISELYLLELKQPEISKSAARQYSELYLLELKHVIGPLRGEALIPLVPIGIET